MRDMYVEYKGKKYDKIKDFNSMAMGKPEIEGISGKICYKGIDEENHELPFRMHGGETLEDHLDAERERMKHDRSDFSVTMNGVDYSLQEFDDLTKNMSPDNESLDYTLNDHRSNHFHKSYPVHQQNELYAEKTEDYNLFGTAQPTLKNSLRAADQILSPSYIEDSKGVVKSAIKNMGYVDDGEEIVRDAMEALEDRINTQYVVEQDMPPREALRDALKSMDKYNELSKITAYTREQGEGITDLSQSKARIEKFGDKQLLTLSTKFDPEAVLDGETKSYVLPKDMDFDADNTQYVRTDGIKVLEAADTMDKLTPAQIKPKKPEPDFYIEHNGQNYTVSQFNDLVTHGPQDREYSARIHGIGRNGHALERDETFRGGSDFVEQLNDKEEARRTAPNPYRPVGYIYDPDKDQHPKDDDQELEHDPEKYLEANGYVKTDFLKAAEFAYLNSDQSEKNAYDNTLYVTGRDPETGETRLARYNLDEHEDNEYWYQLDNPDFQKTEVHDYEDFIFNDPHDNPFYHNAALMHDIEGNDLVQNLRQERDQVFDLSRYRDYDELQTMEPDAEGNITLTSRSTGTDISIPKELTQGRYVQADQGRAIMSADTREELDNAREQDQSRKTQNAEQSIQKNEKKDRSDDQPIFERLRGGRR